MKSFNRHFLIMFVSACLVLVAVPANAGNPVGEDLSEPEYNSEVELRPELGPRDPDAVVGENGYRVFMPGSIARVPIVPEDDTFATSSTLYRAGWTDAWVTYNPSSQWGSWDHFGDHTSESDLWEDEIWAPGHLKIKNVDDGWRDRCEAKTSGDWANCGTHFNQNVARTILAKTKHYFHSSGYKDSDFWTQDEG